jgi:hypothetical protein
MDASSLASPLDYGASGDSIDNEDESLSIIIERFLCIILREEILVHHLVYMDQVLNT